MTQALEAAMVLCFGLSWPMSLLKSWRGRTAKGKSLPFLLAIDLGYVAGIAAKLLAGSVSYVLVFYMVNFLMVSADVALYFRNRTLDRQVALWQQEGGAAD
ncbi:MAG: hypothetical protein LBJ11_11890 [Oscillospiraceae bacterium]|jgi:hypothetical protein|nr:hypothetical protein [Oscillospiraceae bacterium]